MLLRPLTVTTIVLTAALVSGCSSGTSTSAASSSSASSLLTTDDPSSLLSPGVSALVDDCDAGTPTPVECVRWSLTLLGRLKDELPAKYATAKPNKADELALSLLVNGTTLSPSDQASVKADVGAAKP